MIYREFIIRSPESAKAAFALVKANAQAAIDSGSPLRIIITADEKRRNGEQNKKLHAMFNEMAQKAWWGNKLYPAEFWKEYFRKLYLLKDEMQTPSGEIVQIYWSTADLSVGRFAELIEQVYADGSTDFGMEWAL